MNLDEHISNTRIFLWSLIVVAGVMLLALLTPEHSAEAGNKRCYFNHQCNDPVSNRVRLHARDTGQYLDIEFDYIRNDLPENPALSCRDPSPRKNDIWSRLLTSSAKQLVISFDH